MLAPSPGRAVAVRRGRIGIRTACSGGRIAWLVAIGGVRRLWRVLAPLPPARHGAPPAAARGTLVARGPGRGRDGGGSPSLGVRAIIHLAWEETLPPHALEPERAVRLTRIAARPRKRQVQRVRR